MIKIYKASDPEDPFRFIVIADKYQIADTDLPRGVNFILDGFMVRTDADPDEECVLEDFSIIETVLEDWIDEEYYFLMKVVDSIDEVWDLLHFPVDLRCNFSLFEEDDDGE